MSLRYYRRPWNESRGDQFDSWGRSVWYFEIDGEGYPARQIELYEHGPVLKYDSDHKEDEHGGLGDQPIDRDDFASFEIKPEEFEAAWSGNARS
ncbi:hypothetical protein BH11MYX4_BH11MYX4_64860 [soil metagenome]